ncbi:SigB/SigF/SigG family RNA polymerase sigma factor [Yinghuangia sp. YIM S09857]|uniref:SigB/SigF/SigG family RNA polymerase sigma factor n=1 Tax=Yinghuangia sp. YIM S09857 TaxID=3436929 RepID=UPI003F536285
MANIPASAHTTTRVGDSAASCEPPPDPDSHAGADDTGSEVRDEALSWSADEIRALDARQARTASDALLRRLRRLDAASDEYSRVRARLVELNLSLVRFAVRGLKNRAAARDDVLQTGTVGLIKAIDVFDPDRGIAFASFALPTIRGEVKRLFRDTCWAAHVPRRQQELFLATTRAADTLHQQLGREATSAEIAAHLDIAEEEVDYGRDADRAYSVDSLDTPAAEAPGGTAAALADRIGAEEPELDLVDFRESVRPLIAELGRRDQRILKLRFWDGLTQSEIGRRLGLSQMHISRLLNRILTDLREHLDGAAEPERDGATEPQPKVA